MLLIGDPENPYGPNLDLQTLPYTEGNFYSNEIDSNLIVFIIPGSILGSIKMSCRIKIKFQK